MQLSNSNINIHIQWLCLDGQDRELSHSWTQLFAGTPVPSIQKQYEHTPMLRSEKYSYFSA